MPNWCVNELSVKGKKEMLNEFIERAKAQDTDLSLNNFVPMPEELLSYESPPRRQQGETSSQFRYRMKKFQKKYGAKDWYTWAVNNWGTKWDIDASLFIMNRNLIEYHFESAWAPPIEAIKKISEQFPELTFDLFYFEAGMGFAGIIVLKNGETIVDEFHEGESMIEWLKKERPDIYEDYYGDWNELNQE